MILDKQHISLRGISEPRKAYHYWNLPLILCFEKSRYIQMFRFGAFYFLMKSNKLRKGSISYSADECMVSKSIIKPILRSVVYLYSSKMVF